MNRPVLRILKAVRTGQPARNKSSDPYKDFTLGPQLLTRPKPKMPKGYERIEAKREIFQRDDGIPTYLKGGPMDNVLYIFTAVTVLSGNIWGLSRLYEWAQK